ncbi:MAG TPA: hypothetical protein VHK69_14905 [Chitinophagaceae bacterium]|jgi:hypothetical protein|nr:hypothetical protein [Chitinophagaceae bacterium]
MQDIINAITNETGLSADKAKEVVLTVSQFVKVKFPLLAGTVDSILGTEKATNEKEPMI